MTLACLLTGAAIVAPNLVDSHAAVPVDVSVDATSAGTPFKHKWKRSFGSGHAALTRCRCREGLYLLFTAGYSALATSKSLSVLEQRYGRACRSTATHIFVVFATI